jgi:hypothetical protein
MKHRAPILLFVCSLSLLAVAAGAQIPRINTFFPMGAKSGSTVEVEVRGASLEGAHTLLVRGQGVTGTIAPGGNKVDETNKPVWQAKCGGCHELRSPANRSLTPAQWAATVDRMVKVRQAPLSADESKKVSDYLMSAARAGRVTAQLAVAADTLPGIYEVRVATARGVSSPYWFEVGNLPEVMAANVTRDQAQPVTLPCVVNGCFMGGGERHFLKFSAKKDERLVFNLKAFRYNETNQFFFSPNLRLYDPSGKQIVENHGYYDMDPLIDWTCPADGEYILEVRDLLGRANPSSVYRLAMGKVPYDSVLVPPAGQVGTTASTAVAGKGLEGASAPYNLTVPADPGIRLAPSPYGPHPYFVSEYKVVRDDAPSGAGMAAAALPGSFTGAIGKAGETDSFPVSGDGTYEFEGYATRLGSPVSLGVALVNAAGATVANFGNDGRMAAKLEANQTYQLRVANNSGQGGPNMVYAIEVHPPRPRIRAVVRPDNVTIRPGVSTAVQVIVNRRDGLEGDITVSAEDLPAGVTVTDVVLAPDRNTAWLQFNAAPNATPGEKPVRVIVSGKGPSGDVKVIAIPQEEYRLNNDPRYRNWSDVTLSVRGQPDFTVEFVDPKGPVKVHPRKGTPVKVRIKRLNGFKGNVTVALSGLPLGWVANQETTGGDEVTLTVRPDGNDTNPFLKRDPKWSPIRATLQANSDDFRFAFGTIEIKRVEVISDRDD